MKRPSGKLRIIGGEFRSRLVEFDPRAGVRPTPVSSLRSLPSMLTRFSASGPLPINVAPFTGRETLPSSIR